MSDEFEGAVSYAPSEALLQAPQRISSGATVAMFSIFPLGGFIASYSAYRFAYGDDVPPHSLAYAAVALFAATVAMWGVVIYMLQTAAAVVRTYLIRDFSDMRARLLRSLCRVLRRDPSEKRGSSLERLFVESTFLPPNYNWTEQCVTIRDLLGSENAVWWYHLHWRPNHMQAAFRKLSRLLSEYEIVQRMNATIKDVPPVEAIWGYLLYRASFPYNEQSELYTAAEFVEDWLQGRADAKLRVSRTLAEIQGLEELIPTLMTRAKNSAKPVTSASIYHAAAAAVRAE